MQRKIICFIIFQLSLMGCSVNDKDAISPSGLSEWKFFTKSKNGLAGNLITTLFTDSKGNVWIGTTTGLSKYDGSTFTTYTEATGALPDNWVLTIVENKAGQIIVGTINGVSYLTGAQWRENQLFSGIRVNALTATNNGDFWAGTSGYGPVQIHSNGDFDQHYDDGCENCNIVESLFENSDGTVWIGSDADLKSFKDGTFKSYSSLSGALVSSIASDHWGNVWFGLDDSPVMLRYDGINFKEFPLVDIFSSHNRGMSILEDRNGLLWIAADYGGLIYFDGAVGRQVFDVFSNNPITALTIDKNGFLWVGTEGTGVVRHFPIPN